VPLFGELKDNIRYTVYLCLVGKRVVDFLLVLIKLFRRLSRLRRYERILVEIVVFEGGWVSHFLCKFQEMGRPPTTVSVRKLDH